MIFQSLYVQWPKRTLVTNKSSKILLSKEKEIKENTAIINLFQNPYVQFK